MISLFDKYIADTSNTKQKHRYATSNQI